MNILVLNGSPKGQYSITLQTIHYLEKCYPAHTFEVLHVGQRIKVLEKDFSPAFTHFFLPGLYLYCPLPASSFYRTDKRIWHLVIRQIYDSA